MKWEHPGEEALKGPGGRGNASEDGDSGPARGGRARRWSALGRGEKQCSREGGACQDLACFMGP